MQTIFAVYICFLVIIRNYFSPPKKRASFEIFSKLALDFGLLFICLNEYWKTQKVNNNIPNNRLVFPQKTALKSSKKWKSEVQVPTDIPKMRFASFYPHCFLFLKKREKRQKTQKTRDFLGFSAVHLFWHRFLASQTKKDIINLSMVKRNEIFNLYVSKTKAFSIFLHISMSCFEASNYSWFLFQINQFCYLQGLV